LGFLDSLTGFTRGNKNISPTAMTKIDYTLIIIAINFKIYSIKLFSNDYTIIITFDNILIKLINEANTP